MAIERYVNLAASTLSGGINNSVTSLDVASASSFPAGGNFRILIDTELMLVTAVASNTFTVTRGVEGTTAASHADVAPVTHVVTAASLANIIDQRFSTTKVNADFGTVNSSDEIMTDDAGSVLMEIVARTANFQWRMRSLAFSGAAVIAGFEYTASGRPSDHTWWGFGLRYSGDSSMALFAMNYSGGSLPVFRLNACTGVTNEGTNIFQPGIYIPPRIWFKVEIVSSVIKYWLSNNGKDFILCYHESVSTRFGANTPDQVVWGGGNWTDRSDDASVMLRLIDWR